MPIQELHRLTEEALRFGNPGTCFLLFYVLRDLLGNAALKRVTRRLPISLTAFMYITSASFQRDHQAALQGTLHLGFSLADCTAGRPAVMGVPIASACICTYEQIWCRYRDCADLNLDMLCYSGFVSIYAPWGEPVPHHLEIWTTHRCTFNAQHRCRYTFEADMLHDR
jgi:hypothetical protein